MKSDGKSTGLWVSTLGPLAKPASHRMGLDYLPSLAFLGAVMDAKKTTCCRYKSLPHVGSFPTTLCQQQTLLNTLAKVHFEGFLLVDCS